jgi:hypothetical protein
MAQRDKSRRPRSPEPARVEKHGPGPPEAGGAKEGRGQAPPSEDFAERRDVETADEPGEEHDRRHHDPRRDVESSQTG